MREVDEAIQFLLRAHEPNMAIVIDRHWNLVAANTPGTLLTSLLGDDVPLWNGAVNVMWLMFHPDGLRQYITNFDESASSLLWRVRDDVERRPADIELGNLLTDLEGLVESPSLSSDSPAHAGLVTSVHFALGGQELGLFSCCLLYTSPSPRDRG